MFEANTYDELLASMLREVPTKVDKREGSIIFDTLSPAALELANTYIGMDIILNNAFAATAEREYLILIARERGLTPNAASRAVLRAEFNFNSKGEEYIGEYVSEGDRFNIDKLNYVLLSQITNDTNEELTVTDNSGTKITVKSGKPIPGAWQIMCETAGTVGNKSFGSLIPISTIEGLTKAEITELLIPGEDEEETEDFRQRYFDSINGDAFGGNRADYIKWVSEIEGVGQVKAKRTPLGGGTVGVIITDSDNKPASAALINNVKEFLDPAEFTGQGEGIAPIGHSVTVSTVEGQVVNVTFHNMEYESEADTETVQGSIKQILEDYAYQINSGWGDRQNTKIYAAQVLARCLDAAGIVNIENAELDGNSGYIVLDENKIVEFSAEF